MQHLVKAWSAADRLNSVISSYETRNWDVARAGGDLIVNANPIAVVEEIALLRWNLIKEIAAFNKDELSHLSLFDSAHIASGRLRGMLHGYSLQKAEQRIQDQSMQVFMQNWRHPDAFRAFTIISFYIQPFEVPLHKNIVNLDKDSLRRYMYFITRQPHIMVEPDEDRYLAYYREMTDWICWLLNEKKSPLSGEQKKVVMSITKAMLTFGTCCYIDKPIGDLIRARARLVLLAQRSERDHALVNPFPKNAAPVAGRQKIRLGIISRNVGDYTDTRALFGMFSGFDPKKYEIYWYSLDVVDPTTVHDVAFYRKLFGRIYKLSGLRDTPQRNAKTILADDLDIMVVGSAYSIGVKPYDQLVAYRLARIQIGFNPMVPVSSGLPSYDYFFVTPPATPQARKNYLAEASETLKFMDDPLVWYDRRPPSVSNGFINRKALGIPSNAVVYFSGAAANKQMPGTMRCWFEILRRVPKSYLMLMPFNPAWGGYYLGLTFLNRLNKMLAEYPDIDPKRIVIVREVTPEEGNQILLQADVYLGSFPHGGATSAMLALVHGVPVAARETPWFRGTSDPSLLRSMGLKELIGADNQGFIDVAVRLGLDSAWRHDVKARIAARIGRAPFLSSSCSKKLQRLFDEIVLDHRLLPNKSIKRAG